jgi:tetratricopeptide (TPR) repeat protein
MSTIGVVGAHALALSLPRNGQSRPSDLSWALQGVGNFAILISMLLTIFYSQSRGPWLGLSAALFVFFTLFLWLARRRAIQANASFAPSLRTAMWAWIGTSVMGVAFVVMFNVSDAPFFERLRQVPYVGRAGTLMEAGSGTGLVRKLIWLGDEHTGGSIELITSNPVRTVVGWGPESMFVAFNPFYPPSLANVESRSASPDRAHQAILDQMITKGLLGLVSYFFVLISFAVLCWRLIIHSKEWRWQILSIALFSGVAGHFVEGFTGIPIVATLMMLWVIIALTVVAGVITGEYTLGALPEPKPAPEPAEQPSGQAATTDESPDQPSDTAESTESTESTESPASSKPSKPSKPSKKAGTTSKGKKERHHNSDGYTSRGSKQEQRGQSTQPKRQSARPTRQVSTAAPSRGASTYGLYALILVLAIAGSWWFNFSSVYADMKFHEGDTFAAQQGAEIYTLNSYLEAIRINPTEDFYYLNLGRNLMSIADKKREASGQMGQEAEDPEMKDLLRLNNLDATATFVQNQMPMELMSYAEAVLERARELNPLNKDHYANLARLNNFWFNLTNDVERLEKSALWYERANEVAPYDVSLINEHASIRMMLGNLASSRGDTEAMNAHFNRARELYETSLFYDENYGEADTRLAEVYRLLGEHEMAAEMAAQAIRRSPHSFDSLLQPMVQSLIGKPDLLLIIRDAYMDQAEATQDADLYSAAGIISVRASDLEGAVEAYEQAVEIAPESVENNRNYTIVLSDTRRYEQAIDAAQATIELMQETGQEDAEIQQFRWVLSQVERQKERQETPATSEIESWFEGRFGGE